MHGRLPLTSPLLVCRLVVAAALLLAFMPVAVQQARAAASPTGRAATAVPLRDYRVQVQAVNDAQAHLNFDAMFFGIEAFGDPIQITPDSPLIAANPKGLIAFIASLIPVFQNFSTPEQLEPYLDVENRELYQSLIDKPGLITGMREQYNNMVSFELYCGWFIEPQSFIAVLKLVQEDGKAVYSPTLFTFRGGEWKLLFAVSGDQLRLGAVICMALENPRRFQMRYRKTLPGETVAIPAPNWRSFF